MSGYEESNFGRCPMHPFAKQKLTNSTSGLPMMQCSKCGGARSSWLVYMLSLNRCPNKPFEDIAGTLLKEEQCQT